MNKACDLAVVVGNKNILGWAVKNVLKKIIRSATDYKMLRLVTYAVFFEFKIKLAQGRYVFWPCGSDYNF
jgi:hypothetical protein